MCHTPAGCCTTGPLDTRLSAPPVPSVPEVGSEGKRPRLACCSWAVCSPGNRAVGPTAPGCPQLVAVTLDDHLHSVVPQLGSQQQVLVFQIFHLP